MYLNSKFEHQNEINLDQECRIKNYVHSNEQSFILIDTERNGVIYKMENIINKSKNLSYQINLTVKITKIACNDSVAHMISQEGVLLSFGDDFKKQGILGLGYTYQVKEPIVNTNLAKKRIIDISVSEKHCCAVDCKLKIHILFIFFSVLSDIHLGIRKRRGTTSRKSNMF